MDNVREDDVWYRLDELKCMKLNALHMSHNCDSMHVGSLLSNTYGRSNNDTINAINAWVATSESLRGLERFANADFGEKRMNARRRTIQVILTAQQRLRTNGEIETDYMERVLSRLSEAFSQDYTRFAAIMGQADMLVVCSIDHSRYVNESNFTESQKIVATKIVISDLFCKKQVEKICSKKEKSPASVTCSPFHPRIKKNPTSTQRDFIEMRFCF